MQWRGQALYRGLFILTQLMFCEASTPLVLFYRRAGGGGERLRVHSHKGAELGVEPRPTGTVSVLVPAPSGLQVGPRLREGQGLP